MDENSKLLINQLLSRKINREEFIPLYFNGTKPNSEYFESLFQTALLNKDAESLEKGIILINAANINSNFLNQTFGELLKENWHYTHEDLAFMLAENKDPETADYLFEAAELQFPYLDYDDTFQFARKCIKGLSAIGDKNAINKLLKLAESRNNAISGYAKKELAKIRDH